LKFCEDASESLGIQLWWPYIWMFIVTAL